jgi:7-keto-8-aminopelargonate synthetase-like enzyme
MFHPIARETSMHMISNDTCETVIAEYIRTKGVTRCPTACVVPTQASVTEADRAALEEYQTAREQQRRERASARARLFWGIDASLG